MNGASIVRVRLGKGDEIRFVSHLGFMRAFERAVRRARIPVPHSEGYHPHPRIQFATALGVGMTSEAEYLDMELAPADSGDLCTHDVFERLRLAAPPGMPIIAVCALEGRPTLASRIEWASYRVDVHATARPELEDAGGGFSCPIMRLWRSTQEWPAPGDIRPMAREIRWSGSGALECTLACGGRAHLRPQDLMAHLDSMQGRRGEPEQRHGSIARSCIHRTGLYFTDRGGGDLVSPMSVECRDLVMAGS